jgi:hypothetical protein
MRAYTRSNPDNTFVLLAAFVGGLYVLLSKSADGTSLLDRLKGPSLPGAPGAPSQTPEEGPANQGRRKFNFNTLETNARFSENTGHLIGHAGFGHVGSGDFVVIGMDVHNTGAGGFFGLFQPWQTAQQQSLQIPDDGDWAGYGTDFDVELNRNLFTGLEVRYWISNAQGTPYQRTSPIGVNVGL